MTARVLTISLIIAAHATTSAASSTNDSIIKSLSKLGITFSHQDPSLASTNSIDLSSRTEAAIECDECKTIKPVDVAIKPNRELAGAEVDVIGVDERRELRKDEEPYFSGIGKIYCFRPDVNGGKKYSGNAWLAADQSTIATNAHLFFVNEPPYIPFDPIKDCLFVGFNDESQAIFKSSFTSIETGGGGSVAPVQVLTSQKSADWAVLRLSEPAPTAMQPLLFGSVSAELIKKPRDVVIVSLNAPDNLDKKNKRFISPNCELSNPPNRSINDGLEQVAFHNCDTSHGTSGSPILHRNSDGSYVVVGVHAGGGGEGQYKGIFNYSVRTDGLFLAALKKANDSGSRSFSSRE